MEELEGTEDLFGLSTDDSFSKDGIAVVVIEDKDILGAMGGDDREATGLVCVDGATGFFEGFDGGIDEMGAFAVGEGVNDGVIGFSGFYDGWLGGAEVFSFLVQVA